MEKIIAGYIRVSTQSQASESLSLDRQRELVKQHGAELIYEDIESASKKNSRTELDKLLKRVQAGSIHTVVTPRLDRLIRSQRHLYHILDILEEAQAELKILDFPLPDLNALPGQVLLSVMGIMAEVETKNLASRVKSEKRQRRSKRYANDIAPLGYIVEKHQYRLDHSRFLCLLVDKPNVDSLDMAALDISDPNPENAPVPGYTMYELLREVIQLFLELKSPRGTIHKFFQKYGIERKKGRRSGAVKVLSWTPDGFVQWLSNPVLQGHTVYFGGGDKTSGTQEPQQSPIEPSDGKNGDEEKLDAPQFLENTHPDQVLLSSDEAAQVFEALKISRRIGNKGLNKNLNNGSVYQPYAYLNGLVYCNECHALCTPKTSHNSKYQYFGCRFAGAGCSNHGNAKKSDIEKHLVQELVLTSNKMQQEAMDQRKDHDNLVLLVLNLNGASASEITDFVKTTNPQYQYWHNPQGRYVKSKLEELKASRAALDNIATHHHIEEAKAKLDRDIEEEEQRENSYIHKDAAELIFRGDNLAFWTTLSSDEKVTIYSKVIDRIFIQDGQVAQINLKSQTSPSLESPCTTSTPLSTNTASASL